MYYTFWENKIDTLYLDDIWKSAQDVNSSFAYVMGCGAENSEGDLFFAVCVPFCVVWKNFNT